MIRRRAVIVLLALLAGIAPWAPSGEARAATSFTFFGSGWGHGLGMSQYGAYGLAQKGWGHRRILTHFYSRTRVGPAPRIPRSIRVGLVQARDRLRITAQGGRVVLSLDEPGGELVAEIPRGETWTVRIRSGRYRILDASGGLVGGQLWGGRFRDLFASHRPHVRVGVAETGHSYRRGHLEFNIYATCSTCSNRLRLIAVVPSQQYLYGLGEVPSSWPAAALRAQAVAARSYAFAKVASLGQHRPGCNCGLYASTIDQVYVGWSKEAGVDGDRWVAAVDDTAGEVVLHDGAPIQAFYSSSSGGHTENNENVWGGSPIAYLRGVCDPGDYTPANPNRVWSRTFTASAVTSRLGLGIGTIRRFTGAVRGVSGRIVTIVAVGTDGRATVRGSALRAALGLPDDRVWINANRNVTGDIRLRYDSSGCRPGLPTTAQASVAGGSRQRFQAGAIYRNADIGRAYWLRGPIYAKYRQRGESRGVLGMARSGVITYGEARCPGVACRRARFESGTIYFKAGIGAHALWGPVLREFLDRGGVFGRLGFPTSDVRWLGDGTRRATFEGGTITCSSGGTCRVS
jgi:SpoIID/LytB domain protein